MKQFYVYLHCKPDGDPFYVGKGHGKRCREFKIGRNAKHKAVVAKHGADSVVVMVFNRASEHAALVSEREWIRTLRGAGYNLVNLTSGGQGLSDPSPETRAKLSGLKMGNKNFLGRKHTEEAKAKMSAARKGRYPTAEGRFKMSQAASARVISEATREKLRNKTITVETRAKLSASLIGNQRTVGYRHTEEAKIRIGNASKGNKYGLGYRHSEETRAAMAKSQSARRAREKLHKGEPK